MDETSGSQNKEFAFGTTTLHGHLLAGEERFSIQWDASTDAVTCFSVIDSTRWLPRYGIYSFSRPSHFLSVAGYPFVRYLQSRFVHQSLTSVQDQLSSQL